MFVAFAAEEVGLSGSQVYAAQAKHDDMQIEAVLNNDIIGSDVSGNGRSATNVLRVFSAGPDDSAPRELARYTKLMAERYVPSMQVEMVFRGDRFLRGGDHTPFVNEGFAAVRLTSASENYDNQHTITDTFANTSVPYATRVVRMNAAVLASLALAPSPPVFNWTWASGPNKGGHVPLLTRGKSGLRRRAALAAEHRAGSGGLRRADAVDNVAGLGTRDLGGQCDQLHDAGCFHRRHRDRREGGG